MQPHLGLRGKFFVGIFCIVLLLGVTMITVIKTSVASSLTATLQQRGVSTARHVAVNAVNPILTDQLFQLELMLHELRDTEDDILYIFVLDAAGQVLAHTFSDGFPSELAGVNLSSRKKGKSAIIKLQTEWGEVIDIAVPLLQGSLGEVRLGLSEAQVRQDVAAIIRLLTWLIVGVLAAGSVAVAIFDLIITRPILTLVAVAQAVSRGEMDKRADLRSSDEIGLLSKTFDSMIEKRGQVEQEKEQLIADLQKALQEIQTLKGIIPICAACKKIRDDKGYWQQIESFIRERTEADFSHGICPDCAQELYPEFFSKDS